VKTHYGENIPPFVVVDESWVLINSICETFNSCDILSYINWAWVAIDEKEVGNYQFQNRMPTRIFLCHVHLLKNFVSKCEKLIHEVNILSEFFRIIWNILNP
jgi:hypothetical protein